MMKSKNLVGKFLKQILHGAGAISFAVAYLTADSESFRVLHVYCGYGFGIIFIIRILVGLFPSSGISLHTIWRRATLAKSIYTDIKNLEINRLLNWQRWYGATMGLIIFSMYALVPPMILAGIGSYEELGGKLARKIMENSHETVGEMYLLMVTTHLLLIAIRYFLGKYKELSISTTKKPLAN
ncbi:cytochrome b/b6 domain-containing protein [Polynucleobacter sp.]|uniref:cytochrome b/b6 domain-containing protein n=1 Tax=Polynucleobacter sp. TaxID=2029855 RepID=UPI002639F476|nr:cytochrome b/b6 domain-containing protein [Polynucleobacter sp.]MCW1965155.1 hypothetical protein [Polynucleobacter sp.]